MRKTTLSSLILLLLICFAKEDIAFSQDKNITLAEESLPTIEDYVLNLLKEEGETISQETALPEEAKPVLSEEAPLEEEKIVLGKGEKTFLEGIVGLVTGSALGWVGGVIGAHSIKGNRDRAYKASLEGISLGSSLGSISSVYLTGNYIVEDTGSFWGTLIGGLVGVLAGGALCYQKKDFTDTAMVVPLLASAGSALGYRYLFPPPPAATMEVQQPPNPPPK